MQKKFFRNDSTWLKKDSKSESFQSTVSWWELFLQKIKSIWNFKSQKKTFHLQKEKKVSKIIPFTQPNNQIEIKGLTVNTLLNPNINIFLFVKETTTLRVFLRDEEKKILHHSSHLVFKGQRDISIILKNNALSHDSFYVQIMEQSGKSQSRRIQL